MHTNARPGRRLGDTSIGKPVLHSPVPSLWCYSNGTGRTISAVRGGGQRIPV